MLLNNDSQAFRKAQFGVVRLADFLAGPCLAPRYGRPDARRCRTHVGLSQNAAGLRGANLAESLIAKLRGRNPPAHTLHTGGESFTA